MKQLRKNLAVVGKKTLRFGARLSVFCALLTLAALVALLPQAPTQSVDGWGVDGWGVESLASVDEESDDSVRPLSLISLANACGLGASSCFKCHNGTRAALPKTDPDTAPWHQQHASVNYSCAGCHQGNPRIIRQDIAHRGLLANPVAEPEKSCASCHGAEEGKVLAERYQGGYPHLLRGNQ